MTNESPNIRLVLVDDHPAVRQGLRYNIEQTSHIVVVGEASNAKDAIALIRETAPHVVLIDLSLQGSMGGEDLIAELKRANGPLTLVYSQHSATERMQRAKRAGARGYVCKDKGSAEVISAIERVRCGEECFPEGELDDTPELTPRETQVAILTYKGLTCEEIGAQLAIGERTVHTYRANIHKKWGTKTTAEIAHEIKIRGLDEVDWTTLVPQHSQRALRTKSTS